MSNSPAKLAYAGKREGWNMIKSIIKRDKREVPFNEDKIVQAIVKAFIGSGSTNRENTAARLTKEVVANLEAAGNSKPSEKKFKML